MEDRKPESTPYKRTIQTLKEFKFMSACIGILTVIAVGFVLYLGKNVFLPLVFAWLISYALAPIVRWLTKRGAPLTLTVLLIILTLFVVLTLFVLLISGRLSELVTVLPSYYDQFLSIVHDLSKRYHVPDQFWATINWSGTIRTYLFSLSGSLIGITSKFTLTLIFLVFILMGSPFSGAKLRQAFTDEDAHKRATGILNSISSQISQFVSMMALISFATGLVVWVALSLLDVQFAVTWGVLAFMLNFIPTVGSIVASIPPIVVAVVQFYPSWIMPLVVAGTLLLIQMVIGNFVTPKIMGDSLNLSPVTILCSLLVWGWIWGIPGALLAVPMASILKITCDNFSSLKPLAVLVASGKHYARAEEQS